MLAWLVCRGTSAPMRLAVLYSRLALLASMKSAPANPSTPSRKLASDMPCTLQLQGPSPDN